MSVSMDYFADVTAEGVFRLEHRSVFYADMKIMAGHRLLVKVSILEKSGSGPQMRFYRGIIVPRVAAAMIDLGHEHWECTPVRIHSLLWSKFGYPGFEGIEDLPRAKFRQYIESIQRFCAIYMEVELPDPQ